MQQEGRTAVLLSQQVISFCLPLSSPRPRETSAMVRRDFSPQPTETHLTKNATHERTNHTNCGCPSRFSPLWASRAAVPTWYANIYPVQHMMDHPLFAPLVSSRTGALSFPNHRYFFCLTAYHEEQRALEERRWRTTQILTDCRSRR